MLFAENMLKEPRETGGVLFRPLDAGDFDRGYCDLLSQLTTCGTTREQFQLRFGELQKDGLGTYFVVVGEDRTTGRVVASGTIVRELKFIHEAGAVAHIEDIVVDAGHRGRRIGEALMDQLVHVAKAAGCYKCILNCSDQASGFYRKCGFVPKEIEMVKYF